MRKRQVGYCFVIITIFVVTAVSNGANLNDGMDGMAAGNSAIIGLALGILAYVSSHIEYAGYLNIMYIPGSEELVIFICAFIGALIGFLWYNAYPAQVFMGDTGSLTIGGIIAVFAIIIHKELLIPILCGVFLLENLSVILQRFYYKAGKRKGVKQRLFKRTPIHDHFRTSMSLIEPGCTVKFTTPTKLFHESKITVRFWIVTIVLAAITIITLKNKITQGVGSQSNPQFIKEAGAILAEGVADRIMAFMPLVIVHGEISFDGEDNLG